MSIRLTIQDGSPHWYLSPDIWVVPGADPDGPTGSPIAGQTSYLWARVGNTGSTDAMGARIDFYWANPALQVTRSNATLVGSAYVDVPAGESQDALCLVPWLPVVVNSGHECLIAVANHSGDPLPSPLPDAFDPPTYRQVAQKNLTVLVARARMSTHALTLSALQRQDKAAVVTAEVGGELDALSLERLGLRGFKPAAAGAVEVGLALEARCIGDKEPLGSCKLQLELGRGTSTAVYARVRAHHLNPGEYQLVHVTEHSKHKLVGGLAFIVISECTGKEQS